MLSWFGYLSNVASLANPHLFHDESLSWLMCDQSMIFSTASVANVLQLNCYMELAFAILHFKLLMCMCAKMFLQP